MRSCKRLKQQQHRCSSNRHEEAAAAAAKSLQSCLTLCNPIDSNPLGSSVPGILQARILEWVAISFSKHKEAHELKLESLNALPNREHYFTLWETYNH